jgi:Flp pilus assembly protein TadD
MNRRQRRAQARRRLSTSDRYYERGLDSYVKSKPEQAVADLDEAIRANPRRAEYYAARGLLLLQQGWADDAEDDFVMALRLDPAQWLVHYARGMRAYQDENFAQAIDHFSRAQRIAPERFEIYYHRGAAFYRAGQPEEARRDMSAALDMLDKRDKRRVHVTEWLALLDKVAPPAESSQTPEGAP